MQLIYPSYAKETDFELFRLIKQNDVKAFEEIYMRYWPNLVNTAYRKLHSKEKAEDIVQNIFIDVYQRRSTIHFTNSLEGYLKQALKFQILNEYRSERIRVKYLKYLLHIDGHSEVANQVEAKELELKIKDIVDGLPERCRQVFLLRRKENLSNKSIAGKLNISECTVEKHMGKALKVLRNQIDNHLEQVSCPKLAM